MRDYHIGFPTAGRWELRFNRDSRMYSELLDEIPVSSIVADGEAYDGQAQSATLNVAAYSCQIFSQDQRIVPAKCDLGKSAPLHTKRAKLCSLPDPFWQGGTLTV